MRRCADAWHSIPIPPYGASQDCASATSLGGSAWCALPPGGFFAASATTPMLTVARVTDWTTCGCTQGLSREGLDGDILGELVGMRRRCGTGIPAHDPACPFGSPPRDLHVLRVGASDVRHSRRGPSRSRQAIRMGRPRTCPAGRRGRHWESRDEPGEWVEFVNEVVAESGGWCVVWSHPPTSRTTNGRKHEPKARRCSLAPRATGSQSAS